MQDQELIQSEPKSEFFLVTQLSIKLLSNVHLLQNNDVNHRANKTGLARFFDIL